MLPNYFTWTQKPTIHLQKKIHGEHDKRSNSFWFVNCLTQGGKVWQSFGIPLSVKKFSASTKHTAWSPGVLATKEILTSPPQKRQGSESTKHAVGFLLFTTPQASISNTPRISTLPSMFVSEYVCAHGFYVKKRLIAYTYRPAYQLHIFSLSPCPSPSFSPSIQAFSFCCYSSSSCFFSFSFFFSLCFFFFLSSKNLPFTCRSAGSNSQKPTECTTVSEVARTQRMQF